MVVGAWAGIVTCIWMKVFVDLVGTGVGAQKQYSLIRKHRPHLFTNSEVNATHIFYWQSFTRHWDVLKRRKLAGKKIVVRVGGFHRENATTTREMLRMADGAVFVCEWLKEWLKAKTWIAPDRSVKPWRLPPKRTTIHNGSEWIGPRNSDVDYLLVRCAALGPVGFRYGLNRSYSVWAMGEVWEDIRKRYPKLNLWILGRHAQELKHSHLLPGWKWKGFKKNPRWHGQGAIALVHLVPDFSPNTVAESISEGTCALVPGNIGGSSELAGCGGKHVKFTRTDKRAWPETECGGYFYQVDLSSLYEAVIDVIENQEMWKRRAREQWERSVDIRRVADKYEKFLDGIT